MVKRTYKRQARRRSLQVVDKPQNASSRNSHKEQPATPPFPYPIAPEDIEELDFVDGRWFCRQSYLRNEYNPEGLSLEAIDCELWYAKEPEGDYNRLLDQTIGESGDDAKSHLRLIPAEDDSTIEKHISSPTPKHLIQPGDARLADLIKAAPMALIRSFDAQDALGRWTYAARWCHDPATRKQAKAFLTLCLPKKMGTPGKAEPDRHQLLAAYDDLCRYCKCIFTCADAVKTKAALVQYFPDATRLVDHGLNLDDILNPKYKKPAPSEISSNYVGAFIGLGSSRIIDIVAETRSAIALSQKT